MGVSEGLHQSKEFKEKRKDLKNIQKNSYEQHLLSRSTYKNTLFGSATSELT